MREFEVSIRGDGIRRGLRNSYRNPRNVYALTACQNYKVTEHGLTTFQQIPFAVSAQQLIGSAIQLDWPEPRILQGKHRTFLTYGTRLFLIGEDDWLLYELSDIRDIDNVSNNITIQSGESWELIDMHNAFFLTNGMSSVMYNYIESIHGGQDYVRGQNFARIQTGCEHRGRMLIGGLDSENFWHLSWKTFFDDWGARMVADFNVTMDMSGAHVMWSGIGLDLFWLFFPTYGQQGYQTGAGYGATRPKIFEDMLRNDMGWMPMPWKGNVVNMRAMANSVMVYGEGGVSALFMAEDTYGRVDFMKTFGINNKCAVGGDESIQVFLDSYGDLWLVEVGQGGVPAKPKKLGYREWFVNSLDTQWHISYDEHEKEFYLCNGLETFILTEFGLSTAKQIITSTAFRDESLICIGAELSDNDMLLVTDEFDNGKNEISNIEWIKIGANKTYNYQVAVDYKYEDDEDWTRSEWFDLNIQGTAYLGYAGRSFRVAVRTNGLEDTSEVEPPDYITYSFKNTDKRFTRGINVANIANS